MGSHESQLLVNSSASSQPSQSYSPYPFFKLSVNFAYLRSKLFVETLAISEPIIHNLTNFQSRPSTILILL